MEYKIWDLHAYFIFPAQKKKKKKKRRVQKKCFSIFVECERLIEEMLNKTVVLSVGGGLNISWDVNVLTYHWNGSTRLTFNFVHYVFVVLSAQHRA